MENPFRKCSIYIITNTVNGKMYIGQTWQDIPARFRGHVRTATSSKKRLNSLHNSILKHGVAAFTIEEIDEAFTQQDADYMEDFYILAGNTMKDGYNQKRGGARGLLSAEVKERLSKRPFTEEHRANLSKSSKGHAVSMAQREQISKTLTGRTIPQESIEKRRRTILDRGSLRGENASRAKLTEAEVIVIKNLLVAGKLNQSQIAMKFDVSPANIGAIAVGKSWSHVKVNGVIPVIRNRRGEDCRGSKLTEKKVRTIWELHAKAWSTTRIAKRFKVAHITIRDILNGITWTHVKVSQTKRSLPRPRKLTERKILLIRKQHATGKYTIKELAEKHRCGTTTIYLILSGKIWNGSF